MKNIDIIRQGYQHFAEGNAEAVLAVFHPEIVWEECESFPYVENDGTYHGPGEIAQHVFAQLPNYFDNFQIEVDEFIDGGEKVVMKGHYSGSWKKTGKKFRANVVHVWALQDGKATHFFQAVDTATIMNP